MTEGSPRAARNRSRNLSRSFERDEGEAWAMAAEDDGGERGLSLQTSSGSPRAPAAAPSWRASAAMFMERNRNTVALGAMALVAVALLGLLLWPALTETAGADAGEAGDPAEGPGLEVSPLGATELLEDARVIPDVLDVFSPAAQMELLLGSRRQLDGADLPLTIAQGTPTITVQPLPGAAPPGQKYVLVVVDPDAPSPEEPSLREWLHWIVTDILPNSKISSPCVPAEVCKEVVPYAKPTPPRGEHRYVFVVYSQPEDMKEVEAPEGRNQFNLRKFAAAYGLGSPVAAIYFSTQPN